MTDTSGPTREAMEIAGEYVPFGVKMENLALAIDAHTAALRAENDRWKEILHEELACTMQIMDALGVEETVKNGKAVMDAQLEAIAQLRERLRLAVEARRNWYMCARADGEHYLIEAEAADAALRAAGVDL